MPFVKFHPVAAGRQIIVIRGLFAIVFLFGGAWWIGLLRGPQARLYDLLQRPVVTRSVLDAVATMTSSRRCHLPLANATAINMAAPLRIRCCRSCGW